MAHFRRQSCGVALCFGGWGFRNNGVQQQMQSRITSPSCLSYFTAASTRSKFQQVQVPVQQQQSFFGNGSGLLMIPSASLQVSASGISALRSSDLPISFLPTPTSEWQRVHDELVKRQPGFVTYHPLPTPSTKWQAIQDELVDIVDLRTVGKELESLEFYQPTTQHKTTLAAVLEDFFEVQFQRRCNRYYHGATRHDKRLHKKRMSMVFPEYKRELADKMTRLTATDKLALRFYCNEAFWKINSALRRCEDRNGKTWHDDKPTLKKIEELRRALFKRSYQSDGIHQGRVFRGSNLPDDVLAELKPGATYCDAGFLSTSKDPKLAFKDQNVDFIIWSLTGASVKQFSRYKEDEVLFQPSTMFRVCKVETIQKKYGMKTKVWLCEMV